MYEIISTNRINLLVDKRVIVSCDCCRQELGDFHTVALYEVIPDLVDQWVDGIDHNCPTNEEDEEV